MSVETFSLLLGWGTVLLQVFAVVMIFAIRSPRMLKLPFFQYVGSKSYHIVFILSLGAVLGSLVYSEIYVFEPCLLCWWQRIFIYPLPILTAIAIMRKERIDPYLFILSEIGVLIALYHVYIQATNTPSLIGCAVDGAVSCTETYITTLGYVSIPVMSLTLLVTVVLLLNLSKRAYRV
jgi:disulfide bond formation protein DsbB